MIARELVAVRSLIVHNDKSGFGSDGIFEFERFLVRTGEECVLRMLPEKGSFEEAVRDAEDFDLVVISGGDGTVSSVLYALKGRDVPVCVFPTGTANLFFANLGNAMEPRALAHACHQGVTVSTDLGHMSWTNQADAHRDCGFALMAGMGFDAQLMKAALPNKRNMGEAAYFAAALANLHPDVTTFSIECDGRTFDRRGISCIVANNAMMQGDIQIVSGSRMDDGVLDLIVLETTEAAGLLETIFIGLLDKSGKNLGRPHLEHFTGRHISVHSAIPMPLQIDGEVTNDTTSGFDVEVLPGANRLIVDKTSPYAPKS